MRPTRKIRHLIDGIGQRHLAVALLVMHIALALAYSLVLPLGEGYDEPRHFAYIRYLVTEKRLPDASGLASVRHLMPKGHGVPSRHPPLYYLTVAPFVVRIEMSEGPLLAPNPHFGNPDGGQNAFVHSDAESWPFQGTALAYYVARMVSVIMGTVTCLGAYLLARELVPERTGVQVATLGIAAFMPSLLFMGSIVNTDIAGIMFCTLGNLLLLRLVRRGYAVQRVFSLALVTVLAFMSDNSSFSLAPTVLVGLVVAAPRHKGFVRRVGRWMGVGVVVAFASLPLVFWSPWRDRLRRLARDVTRPGGLAAYGAFLRHGEWRRLWSNPRWAFQLLVTELRRYGTLVQGWEWDHVGRSGRYAFQLFVAGFGWGNVALDDGFYTVLLAMVGLALVGVGRWAWTKADGAGRRGLLILGVFSGSAFAVASYFILLGRYGAFPGRYLVPASPVLALVLALGVQEIVPSGYESASLVGVVCLFLMLSLVSLFFYIMPAYAQPAACSPAEIEGIPHRLEHRFGSQIELVGYGVETDPVVPGQGCEVVLYWRALEDVDRNYTVDLQLLDHDLQLRGAVRTYPGKGNFPTSMWEPGVVFADRYRIEVGEDLPVPSVAHLKVDLYERTGTEHLPIEGAGPDGDALVFGRLRGYAETEDARREAQGPPLATFGQAIALHSVEVPPCIAPGERASVTLHFSCREEMVDDYTVFVHLRDEEGHTVAQHDDSPRDGRYPTAIWAPGDVVAHEAELVIPRDLDSTRHQLVVGWYDPGTLQRLPAHDAEGHRLEHDLFPLGKVGVCP